MKVDRSEVKMLPSSSPSPTSSVWSSGAVAYDLREEIFVEVEARNENEAFLVIVRDFA